MRQLNNLTQFDDFKKIYEDIGTEFSNKTGFAESLVGRATFGLMRLVKKGVDAVRLEFFKRRLENEYFGGVLRYCKKFKIDLKNPQKPVEADSAVNEQEENKIVEISNDILMIKYNVPDYDTLLVYATQLVDSGITTLGTVPAGSPEEKELNDFNVIKTTLIPNMQIIDDNFNFVLTNSGGTPAILEPKLTEIKTKINEIRSLVLTSPSTPTNLTYVLSVSEKKTIEDLKVMPLIQVDTALVTSLDEMLVENLRCNDEYFILNEKVNNSSGTNLGFILGDELTTDGVDKFLRDQGVSKVEDINFKQLASIFDDKMRENCTKEVNKNGVIRIQQGVAKIIYHVTKTPDNVGFNPGTGGGVTETPTALMNPWKKKVEMVKGEFRTFLNVDTVDPFNVKVTDYNSSEDPGNKNLNSEDEKVNEIGRLVKIEDKKLTLKFIREKSEIKISMIRIFTDKFYGCVVKPEHTKTTNGLRVYKYLGCINMDEVIKDLDKATGLDNDTKKYDTSFPNKDSKGLNLGFLKSLMDSKLRYNNKDLVGVYFVFDNPIVASSSGEKRKNSAKIFFIYHANGSGRVLSQSDINVGTDVYNVTENGKDITLIPTGTKLSTVKSVQNISVGEMFSIEASPFKVNDDFKIPMVNISNIDLLTITGIEW
jgi:hypothetical protein